MTSQNEAPNRAPWPEAPILLVDDDEQWITVCKTALRSMGWRRIRALSESNFASRLAGEFSPSCILLDLVMANKDGIEVLDELNQRLPDVPVIIVTGVDQVEEAVVCMQHGAADYLTKPLDRASLESALSKALVKQREEERTAEEEANQGPSYIDLLRECRQLPDFRQAPEFLIDEALRRSNGVVKDAARMLNISPQAICNRKRRAMDREEADSDQQAIAPGG